MLVDFTPGSLEFSGILRSVERTGLDIDLVIHIGANVGQELPLYNFFKSDSIQIEPDPSIFLNLKEECIKYSGENVHLPVNLAISDKNGSINLHRYEDSCHNSTLIRDPSWNVSEIVETIPVKSIKFIDFLNAPKFKQFIDKKKHIMLVVDTQGHEPLMLSSLPKFREGCNILSIYCEVSHKGLYLNNPTFTEINKILEEKGYLLENVNFGGAAGNALYCGDIFFIP